MKIRATVLLLAGFALAGCSVWPVNEDPKGMDYRRDADQVIIALQNYHKAHARFPASLNELTPSYLPALPDGPNFVYHATDGSLEYRYTPSWPQLRPVWCSSVSNTTEWNCQEHIL